MEKSRFNYAWVIAIIALLAYSYISYLGLIYWSQFPAILCALAIIAIDVLIVSCVRIMCKAKHSRWLRIGTLGQYIFGFFVLCMLLGSSLMFSHFTHIVDSKNEILECYRTTTEDAKNLSQRYDSYVESRCASYRESLSALKVNSHEYNDIFKNSLALGLSKKDIINRCVVNLELLLKGNVNNSDIEAKRKIWLNNATSSIWNVSMPKNINDLTTSVNNWINNYSELSSRTYTGETIVCAFEDDSFNKNVGNLRTMCTTLTTPKWWAILLALFCFVLIILPWISTPKNMASVGGSGDEIIEMPDEDED